VSQGPQGVPDRDASAGQTEQTRAERVVAGMMEHDAFSRWMGMTVLEVRPRHAVVRMTVRDEMLNGFGVCHGGVTFSLADSAFAFASNTHGRLTMSVDAGISYPVSVRSGDVLTASAEHESDSGPLAFYRVTVRNQSEVIVALFRGTVYKTKRDFFGDDPS
jgi:acyl-CoA thioesterase